MEELLAGGDWTALPPTSGPLFGFRTGMVTPVLCLSGIELHYFNLTFFRLVTTLTELTRFLLQCTSTVLGAQIPLAAFAACDFCHLL